VQKDILYAIVNLDEEYEQLLKQKSGVIEKVISKLANARNKISDPSREKLQRCADIGSYVLSGSYIKDFDLRKKTDFNEDILKDK